MLHQLAQTFAEKIPFTQNWQFEIKTIEADTASIYFPMQPFFIGNFLAQRLHGGVTATVLDTIGGLATMANVFYKAHKKSKEIYLERFSKTATIDMRVDYLNPGVGTAFIASAVVLRSGKKIVTTRMELHNQDDVLIATGIATYSVG